MIVSYYIIWYQYFWVICPIYWTHCIFWNVTTLGIIAQYCGVVLKCRFAHCVGIPLRNFPTLTCVLLSLFRWGNTVILNYFAQFKTNTFLKRTVLVQLRIQWFILLYPMLGQRQSEVYSFWSTFRTRNFECTFQKLLEPFALNSDMKRDYMYTRFMQSFDFLSICNAQDSICIIIIEK